MKSILITGCSSGIGLSTALILKQRGYRVLASARKDADVQKLIAQGLEAFILDLSDTRSIQAGLEQALKLTGGTLNAVFNNAGYLQAGAVEDVTRDQDREQFETNVFGAMDLIRRVIPIMRKQGHGRIIQNSSILGIVTVTLCGSYNASKFAIEGYCRTLRQELLGSGIHVSLVNPGPVKSQLRQNAYQKFDRNLLDQTSQHQATYQQMEKTYFKANREKDFLTLEPDAVVKQVIHALESARPKVHYYTGMIAKAMAFARRVLPDKWLDWVLVKTR